MNTFSLIIPTINRKVDLELLLSSVVDSNFNNYYYEIIIVDQNQNGLIDDICENYAKVVNLKHYKVNFTGVSKARNYGLKHAKGDIINFPDDDCVFSEQLLLDASDQFENSEIDLLFGKTVDIKTKKTTILNFPNGPLEVKKHNIYTTTIECTMFIRKQSILEVGLYDETLGVGTKYGAEEGADFVLRALYLDKRIMYNPKIIFYHPDKSKEYNGETAIRAYNYGLGLGRLTIKHLIYYKNISIFLRFGFSQLKLLMKIICYFLLTRNNDKIKYLVYLLKGRCKGFILSIREYMSKTNN